MPLDNCLTHDRVEWLIKGHTGHAEYERCDVLAVDAAEQARVRIKCESRSDIAYVAQSLRRLRFQG